MNKNILWIVLALAIILLGASYWKTSQEPRTTGETIKIGLAVSLTGYAANWGGRRG